jgi:hypothetical protein
MKLFPPFFILPVMVMSTLHAQAPRPSAADWQADLRATVHTIDSVHPWPWRRITADSFHRMARRLNAAIPSLPQAHIVTRMMELVASLQDGHTTLHPAGRTGFDRWFPVRLFRFSDSLAVTAADSAHADLAGARVVRIGGEAALAVADRVAKLSGADNEWGARQLTGLLSNAAVMRALRYSDGQTLELEVRPRAGASERVRLEALTATQGDPGWMQRGEMFGPPGVAVATSFDGRPPLDYRRMSKGLPLHLRNRIPIWFTWLPEDSTLYVQSNFVQDFHGTSFAAVVDSVFAAAADHPVRRIVLDLRYNSGGDGSKVLRFVHGMIRHPELDQAGRFVVLTGGKTFSAAVLWLSQLREHTTVITVGEPAGAPRNHSGDAGTVVLPRTGMRLQVSSLRHYGTRSDDTSRAELPDFPIAMTAGDYFAGRDPPLDFARHAPDLRTVPQLAVALGADSALAESQRRTARFGQWAGWHAFQEGPMNAAGYALLEAGKAADAVAVFRANAAAYPSSANVWDSLGESLLMAGDTTGALASYRRAVALDPGNQNAREVVSRLGSR